MKTFYWSFLLMLLPSIARVEAAAAAANSAGHQRFQWLRSSPPCAVQKAL